MDSMIKPLLIGIGLLFIGDSYRKVTNLPPALSFIIGIIIILSVFLNRIWGRKKVTEKNKIFEAINKENLLVWGRMWGGMYEYINRIILYALPPTSVKRYSLYFELDIFTPEGEKQYESTAWGGWDNPHFPVEDIDRFKTVYNTPPTNSDYINEWEFTVDKPLGVHNLPSFEVYRKNKT